MRISGYVVLYEFKKGHWDVFYCNGAVLIGETLEEALQLIFNERELNEPEDWVGGTTRVQSTVSGEQWVLTDRDTLESLPIATPLHVW